MGVRQYMHGYHTVSFLVIFYHSMQCDGYTCVDIGAHFESHQRKTLSNLSLIVLCIRKCVFYVILPCKNTGNIHDDGWANIYTAITLCRFQ